MFVRTNKLTTKIFVFITSRKKIPSNMKKISKRKMNDVSWKFHKLDFFKNSPSRTKRRNFMNDCY